MSKFSTIGLGFKNLRPMSSMKNDLSFFTLVYPVRTIQGLANKYHLSQKYFKEICDRAYIVYYLTINGETKVYHKLDYEFPESDCEFEWAGLSERIDNAVLNSKLFRAPKSIKCWHTAWRRFPKPLYIQDPEVPHD